MKRLLLAAALLCLLVSKAHAVVPLGWPGDSWACSVPTTYCLRLSVSGSVTPYALVLEGLGTRSGGYAYSTGSGTGFLTGSVSGTSLTAFSQTGLGFDVVSQANDGIKTTAQTSSKAAIRAINTGGGYAGYFDVPSGGVAVQGHLPSGQSGWAGYFEGPIRADSYTTSDRRLKKNIKELPSQTAGIMSLRLVSWDWLDGHDADKAHAGVIAQEIQKVFPDVVREDIDKDHTLTVNYTALVPRLLKLAQEQEARIAKLEAAVQP